MPEFKLKRLFIVLLLLPLWIKGQTFPSRFGSFQYAVFLPSKNYNAGSLGKEFSEKSKPELSQEWKLSLVTQLTRSFYLISGLSFRHTETTYSFYPNQIDPYYGFVKGVRSDEAAASNDILLNIGVGWLLPLTSTRQWYLFLPLGMNGGFPLNQYFTRTINHNRVSKVIYQSNELLPQNLSLEFSVIPAVHYYPFKSSQFKELGFQWGIKLAAGKIHQPKADPRYLYGIHLGATYKF